MSKDYTFRTIQVPCAVCRGETMVVERSNVTDKNAEVFFGINCEGIYMSRARLKRLCNAILQQLGEKETGPIVIKE